MSKWIAGVAALCVVAGCASIMQGTSQSVGINSAPSGATVTVDGVQHGLTPTVATLSRKDHHIVKIELQGYEPYSLAMTRSVSGWVAGNIIFGGLIGLAVDAISGGMYKLSPEQISQNLTKTAVSTGSTNGLMYVTVVMHPDPSWQKVGQLQRISLVP